MKIKDLVNSDLMISSDELSTIFLLLEVKKGTDIELFYDDREKFKELKNLLESYQATYWVKNDLKNTTLETLYNFSEDERLAEMMNREYVKRLYISRDRASMERFVSYRKGIRKKMFDMGFIPRGYHEAAGEFYGYPKQDIKAFKYRNYPEWKKALIELVSDPLKGIDVDEALKKYGDDLNDREKELMNAFTDHILADTRESFQKQLDLVKRRKEALQDEGFDLDHFIELKNF